MRYDEFAEELRKELPGWVSDGVVTPEQAGAIAGRYGQGAGAERRRSRAVQAVAVIGAVAAGLGVILFFAASWDAMPREARVLVLLVALAGSYGAGWLQLERRPIVGRALILVGAIAFGAGIFLVGQMYNVQAHDPLAFALWSAGVAPLAWILRSRALTTLTLLTLGGWIVYELVDALEDLPSDDIGVLAIPVALLLYGVALYGSGTAARGSVSWARGPMRGLGYALVSAGAFVLTFAAVHREVEGGEVVGTVTRLIIVLSVLAVAGAGALLLARRATAGWELLVLLALTVLTVVTALSPLAPTPAAVLFNLLLAALALGAVAVGYAEDELWLATAGLAVLTVDVLARFLDLSWGLLSRSTAFLAAGLLLLGLAYALERTRSRLASRMAVR